MSITIRQIAKIANVSRGTVDRALNHRPGIKPEIAEQIRQLASDLGYKPNLAAKLLSDHQYGGCKIGIILVTENNPFYDDILQGAKACLAEQADFGIESVITILEDYDDGAKQVAAMEDMAQQGVGGLVMTPICSEKVAEKINELTARGIATVTINSDLPETKRISYVGCCHEKSGEVLAGILNFLSGGRPLQVGAIAGPEHNIAVMQRKDGFLKMVSRDYPNIHIAAVFQNESNEKSSYRITEKLLANFPVLDVLCVLGAGVIGSIQAVRDSGRAGTLKVITYDLIQAVQQGMLDGVVDATITQEPFQQGFRGVKTIISYLAYKQPPKREYDYTRLAILTKQCLNQDE